MKLPTHITRYATPGSSSSSSVNYSLDHSGHDGLVKMQDELGAAKEAKFAAGYGGDIASSVNAGKRIRDLVTKLQAYDPSVNESNYLRQVTPLSRLSSYSSSNSSSVDGSSVEGRHSDLEMMGAMTSMPPVPAGGPPKLKLPTAAQAAVDRKKKSPATNVMTGEPMRVDRIA